MAELPHEPRTPNEEAFDAQVRHQVYLILIAAGLARQANDSLNDSEEAIAGYIRTAFAQGARLQTRTDLRRIALLMGKINRRRSRAWDAVRDALMTEIAEVAVEEPSTLKRILNTAAVGLLSLRLPPTREMRRLIRERAFEGRTLAQWIDKLQADDFARISASVRAGAVSQESTLAITRRVIGTARLEGADGALEITRRQLSAVTQTGVTFAAEEAQREFALINDGLVELYVAVLDNRTTAICRSLDGKRFQVGVGPQPPLHFNCRSRRVLLFAELAAPEPVTYATWLARQPAEFQDEVLGKAKGKLFRNGALDLEQFVTPAGRELRLDELVDRV